MNKKELTEKRRRKLDDKEEPVVSEGRVFLKNVLDSNLIELKKVVGYANGLRSNIKIIKELLKEVK